MQDAGAEQVEVGPAEHLPFQHLDPVELALDGPELWGRVRPAVTVRLAGLGWAVSSSGLVTKEDLDEFGRSAFDADDPLSVAAVLVEAVERDRIAEVADIGHALVLAAEIVERSGDLDTALGLADRAVEAYRRHGDDGNGFPRAFRAELLLRLGRADEGMAELAALRALLMRDPDAVSYVSEALEAGGRAEVAEQWLTAALQTLLERRAGAGRSDPAGRRAAMMAYGLAQQRHRLRRALDLVHDELDDLADRLRDAVHDAFDDDLDDDDDDFGDDGYEATAVLFWPRAEFDQVLARWPVLAGVYGASWDEHRARLQRGLVTLAESGCAQLAVLAGSAHELGAFAARHGGDPTDAEVRQGYAEDLQEHPRRTAWPPGRNDGCWCGSGGKYKKCCLPRTRT